MSVLMDKKITINKELCMKCALCARVCPMQLSPYTDYDERCQLKSDDCIRCGACVANCPAKALSFEENREFTGEPCPHKKKRKELYCCNRENRRSYSFGKRIHFSY